MSSDKSGGSGIFIGNIPYGLTEEQIQHIFGQCGAITDFRLVYDPDTGRPRGYGFAQYSDPDAAASAVRNLDNYEVMSRRLKVDYSKESGDKAPSNYNASQLQAPPPPLPTQAEAAQSNTNIPFPPGVDLPAGLTCPDAISRTLHAIPPPTLVDALTQMKAMAHSDPARATEIFRQAPQLAYAIFQSLLLLGLVDTTMLTNVVSRAQAQPQQPVPPPPQPGFAPPGFPPHMAVPMPMHTATPPTQGQFPPPPPLPVAPAPPKIDPAIAAQLMAMSMDQINALAPEHRQQIMALRMSLQASGQY